MHNPGEAQQRRTDLQVRAIGGIQIDFEAHVFALQIKIDHTSRLSKTGGIAHP